MEQLFESVKKWAGNLRAGEFFTYYLVSIFFITSFTPGNWMVGFGSFVAIIAVSYGKFVIYIPAVKAFALHNKLSDKIRSVGSGWRLRLPWEEIHEKISLKVVPGKFEETYNSEDGVDMPCKIGYQYKPDPDFIGAFIKVDKETIEEALEISLNSCASALIASNNAKDNNEKVDKRSKQLLEKFQKVKVQELDIDVYEKIDSSKKEPIGIEKAFGIDVVLTQFKDIAYPKKYREAKMASSVAEQNVDAAKIYQIDESVTGKDAINFVQVQDQKSSKSIKEYDVEGLENFGKNLGGSIGEGIGAGIASILGIQKNKGGNDE